MTYHLAVGVNGDMPNDKCGINQRKRKAMKVRDGATAKRFSSTVYYNDSGHISLWPPYHGAGVYVNWKFLEDLMI
tara:strand:+ start:954 stop:1178 length:225 start_codon:yes stop_codon:yes gene_type:complete